MRLCDRTIVAGRLCLRHAWSLLLAWWLLAAAPLWAAPLVLDDAADRIDAWPAVTMLADEGGRLKLEDAYAARLRFTVPDSAYATLGLRKEVIWLRAPLQVAARSDGDWMLDIDYTLLNRVEVFVYSAGQPGGAEVGQLLRRVELGNQQPFAQRPIRGRTHAVLLHLPAGADYELLMRIESMGSKILPITLSKPSDFHLRSLNEQMLQGLLIGLSVCLLIYSLMQWRVLNETVYLKYALLITGSAMFSVQFFGIGEQYLWTDNEWLERHMAGITSLVAACGTALFVEEVLGSDMSARVRKLMRWLAAVLATFALAHGLDLVDIRGVSVVMSTLGLLPALIGLPGTVARMRRGDVVGAYFMFAWVCYFIASAIMVRVVKGETGATPLTMHSFQIGATIDMLVFMRIAVLGTKRLRHELEEERRRFIAQQKFELEQKVIERTEELAKERERAESLLRNILPPSIAEELKESGSSVPRRYDEVSVLFTDLVNFTRIVADIPAGKTVSELNDIFTAFDRIVARHGLEKINTVGDAYMAAAGVPVACADHAQRCAMAGLEMQRWLAKRNETAEIQWGLRAGIHSGSVVAGVVGSTKYAYGIWGDTVNVASRMESASERGRVNISADTRARLGDGFECEYRGKVSAKGKGEIDMYFLHAGPELPGADMPVLPAVRAH